MSHRPTARLCTRLRCGVCGLVLCVSVSVCCCWTVHSLIFLQTNQILCWIPLQTIWFETWPMIRYVRQSHYRYISLVLSLDAPSRILTACVCCAVFVTTSMCSSVLYTTGQGQLLWAVHPGWLEAAKNRHGSQSHAVFLPSFGTEELVVLDIIRPSNLNSGGISVALHSPPFKKSSCVKEHSTARARAI